MKKTLTILAFIVFIILPVFGAGMVTSWYCTPRIIVKENIVETEVPMKVTAYCPCNKCCGKWSDGMTACGHVIKKGEKFCAAPPEIPFGTIIEIPGYGKVPVLDRGGAIKGNKLDVFFDNHNDALEWGVKYMAVRVWPKGE